MSSRKTWPGAGWVAPLAWTAGTVVAIAGCGSRGGLKTYPVTVKVAFPDGQVPEGAIVTFRLAETSLALAAYRADHGGYPERLDDLVPEYVDEVPRDVFVDDELRYVPRGDDYLLYSVGPNLEDEEGRTRASNPWGDDVVIRTAPER